MTTDERAAGSRVPSPPADVADALDSARVWKEHYPYYTTGGAGQAYTAFLSVWSILGKLEAALRAAVVAAQEPDK